MNRQTFTLLFDALMAVVMGAVTAFVVFPLAFFTLVAFIAVTVSRVRSRMRSEQGGLAFFAALVSVSVFAGVIAGAWMYRPAKTVERVLDRKLALPAREMALAELAYYAQFERPGFPTRISFCFADADQGVVVRWPARELTLRQFLAAIESQTALRGRFGHCGNGFTVLGGGDCSFGLYIRDPKLAVRPFPRERFDVHAYASRRDAR